MRFIFLILVGFLLYNPNLFSQNEEDNDDPLRYYKAKYEEVFNEPLDSVVSAVVKSIEDLNCVVILNKIKTDKNGFFKALVKSDFCVFSEGTDSTFDLLRGYSVKMPFIPGGKWKNGRMQYKFVIKELADGSINLYLKGNLSGYEDYVTNRVHFWTSNGILEHNMLERIKANLAAQKKE